MKEGDNIFVGKHWLRGRNLGRIVAYDGKRTNPWLVRFDAAFPGGGFTVGDKPAQHLWLAADQLEPAPTLARPKRPKRAMP